MMNAWKSVSSSILESKYCISPGTVFIYGTRKSFEFVTSKLIQSMNVMTDKVEYFPDGANTCPYF